MKNQQAGILSLVMLLTGCVLLAQSAHEKTTNAPIAASASPAPAAPVAAAPAPRTFHDPTYKLSFDYPGNWIFTRRDREISTFRLDARSAARTTVLRAVASMPENPFPDSTFSGAYFYFSVTPHSYCEFQTSPTNGLTAERMPNGLYLDGILFSHGRNLQKSICTIEHDDVYTVSRNRVCYRFDLAINTFCGGQVSGVKDITEKELNDVRARMEAILGTVRFDPK